jgi:pentatricopeptide repeat protein
MTLQLEFYNNQQTQLGRTINVIVPDIKAANILMNCYAKLGDVESAESLMKHLLSGNDQQSKKNDEFSSTVPFHLQPNIVTYNSLLDACHKTGELDKALHWKQLLFDSDKETSHRYTIRLDARTSKTLIATVACKVGQTSSGMNDPSLGFRLLKEMQSKNLRPNGLTYSALIDLCGRCSRSDLALQALRWMIDDTSNLPITKS